MGQNDVVVNSLVLQVLSYFFFLNLTLHVINIDAQTQIASDLYVALDRSIC